MTTCTHHKTCIKTALKRAEDICIQSGGRLTKQRRQVLELIWQNHQAYKAYDILDKMTELDKSAKPPTVYRALDFLQEQGLVHKIQSLNAYVGCPHPDLNHSHQFLICESCGHVDDIHESIITNSLTKIAESNSFKIAHQTVEVFGLCKKCT